MRVTEPSKPSSQIARGPGPRGVYCPTERIGQLSTVEVVAAVSCPFATSWLIWLSLVSSTGVTPGFHLTTTSSQIGD